jgi:hypothetical protein
MQGKNMKVRFGTLLTRQQRIKLSKRIGVIRRELAQELVQADKHLERASEEPGRHEETSRCIEDLKRLEEKMRRINEGFK